MHSSVDGVLRAALPGGWTALSLDLPHPCVLSLLQEWQQEEEEVLLAEVAGTLRHAAQRCATGHDRPFWPAALNARLGLALDTEDKASPSTASGLPSYSRLRRALRCPVTLSSKRWASCPPAPADAAAPGNHPADGGAHERAPPAAAGSQAAPELRWPGGAGQGDGRVEVVLVTLQDAWDHLLAQPESTSSEGGGGSSGAAPQGWWIPGALKARLTLWAADAASAAQSSLQSRLPSSELLLVKPSVVGERGSEWLGIRWPSSKEGA